ncbi:MAG TPA: hypothetical protein VFR29_10950 [Steroidobacteraceae bacterium]|nr:hypothetical protein [Steroidobacteraceae bacterium]
MRLPAALTSVHKWIGVVIGIQVVLWVAGGLVMSAFPIELVRGETQAAHPEPAVITALELGADLREAIAAHGPVTGLRTLRIAGRLYVEAQRAAAPPFLIDAADGRRINRIDEATAREVAARDFTGEGRIVAANLLTEGPGEYRGPLPVWQVRLDDARDTAIYVSAHNGQVVARRTDIWRLYDFFWMLHIMDYKERVDFNHALLIGASALALVLAATGFWLLFYRIRIRRGR